MRFAKCFHSISFPSEWGVWLALQNCRQAVSIQLVSPASGEFEPETIFEPPTVKCFHSISFPNEWGRLQRLLSSKPGGFHSISFPNKWGEFHHTPHTTQCVQRRFLPALTKLPDRPYSHPLDIIKSVPLSPQSP